jgi:hypothetical protein
MTTKYFNVKQGIKTGNIVLDAASGNANVANISVTSLANVANLSVGLLTSNLIPNSNGVLSLGNTTSRYSDFYLTGNIDLNGQIIKANTDTVIFSGNISANVGKFETVTVNTQLIINSTTDSTSTDSGSMTTLGGVGIKKDLTVGGNINLATASSTTPKGSINYDDTFNSIDFKFK